MGISDEARQFVHQLSRWGRAISSPDANRWEASEARAALARLRRAAGKEPWEASDAWPIVFRYLPNIEWPGEKQGRCPWVHRAFFMLGGLFALHPKNEHNRAGFGDTMRQIATRARSKAGSQPGPGNVHKLDSHDMRMMALLRCSQERVGGHLRQAISLAKAHEVSVDYEGLLLDILRWDEPERKVQLGWARHFWHSNNGAQKIGPVADADETEETEE